MQHLDTCAIVGGGFTGLALANLVVSRFQHCTVTIYDSEASPGLNGASVVAGGLMHPFTPKAKLIWKGLEGFQSSALLLEKASRYSETPFFAYQPIFRPCSTQDDLSQWMEASKSFPQMLQMASMDYIQRFTDDKSVIGGALLTNSIVVNPPYYLKALWNRVLSISPYSTWKKHSLTESELDHLSATYNAVVIAAGPGVRHLWSSSKHTLPFKYVKGQNIVYQYQSEVDSMHSTTSLISSPLKHPILKGEYCVPDPVDPLLLVCGATHEYFSHPDKITAAPDPLVAHRLLDRKLSSVYSSLSRNYQPIQYTAGIRVMPERSHLGKIPVVCRHSELPNVWMAGGLGARGLIHHAYVADVLLGALVKRENGACSVPVEMSLRT